MEIDKKILNSLFKEAEAFPEVHLTSGGIVRHFHKYGSYEEQGLEIKREDEPLFIYYAGLTVLARDLYLNLPKLPSEETKLFNSIVSSVAAEDQKLYPYAAFPYTDQDSPMYNLWQQLPKGMAVAAAAGRPSIKQLGKLDIVHEWTVKPGKRLAQKFGDECKEPICKGKGSPYNKYIEKKLRTQEDLRNDIAITILKTIFSAHPVWWGLAVQITAIIIKTPLRKYCEF